MAAHEKERLEKSSKDRKKQMEKERDERARYDSELPCPICKEPSRRLHEQVDLEHEGSRINMHGLKLMGGEITKPTVTQYRMTVAGLECVRGHRFFTDATSKRKALCPLCTDEMMEYGSSLFSCTRCNRHFSKADWDFPDESVVLTDAGWIEAD
jgi:hypothetical protein